ncbi:nucleotidyltransferase substrate binding protein [Actinobacillus lignieresii]|uniref:HI0074 family nucleotidyltransferase substrate-binding subunit n=1 Tax=Actinobacillus lignieresii TaxID=720 RepID=UPI000E182C01|nr:HI0074 family nucleotidyltransferase substrate-binding subunit [Actinobacillus lignieresii]SUT95269.1 nucleotidyltransferase substrate binding protein [Actinobacillus lignieresii]
MVDRLKIDTLEDAFYSLEETIKQLSDLAWFTQQKWIVQDTLIAGAIQKFEFVYELSLKMMKRQLQQEAINNDDVGGYGFKDILREALRLGIINDMSKWVEYRDMHNITSHTYDQQKADAVYSRISDFLEQSRFLVEQLRRRNQDDK